MSRSAATHDEDELRDWVLDRADGFPPLRIVSAEVDTDEDSDGEPTFLVTVHLEPPAGADEPWSIEAMLALDRAVREWGREHGYASGPHVLPRSTDPADAA